MKNLFYALAAILFMGGISSCTKENAYCGPNEHWDNYYKTCVPNNQGCTNCTDPCTTCGGGGNNGGINVSVLEPYKSAIITQVNAVGAFQNDGAGYAKHEVSGYVSQGAAATYKRLQIWLYVGNGMFRTDFAGCDNHASGSSASTYQTLNGLMSGNVVDLALSAGRITNFSPSGKYAVATLAMGPPVTSTSDPNDYEMLGSTTSVNETDYSQNVSAQHPERLKLTALGGFMYEITSTQVYYGNQLFAWQ